jgi:twitching motility two-component system response regulator PilH
MLKILVTDDSPTSRAIISRLIGDVYEVRAAASGADALAELAAGGVDLLLLDLLMPGMDGMAVLSELRSRGSGVPVVVVTADIQESTRSRVLALGARSMVNKPVNREKLLDAIAAALGAPPAEPS